MGSWMSCLGYSKIDDADDKDVRPAGSILKQAFAAVASVHFTPGVYFIFPFGSVVRVDYRNDCMLSKMEEEAKRKRPQIQ